MKPKHLLALGVFLVGITSATSPLRAQKPAPQPTKQQKLEERVDALESQLKEAQAKADRAAMEKDYVERIQKETKDYYDKVLTTQTWTLGIVGLIITIVSAATARFGLTIFDRHIEQAVSKATTDLGAKFEQKMREERQELEKLNAAQISRLEDDVNCRTYYNFYLAQGQAAGADRRHEDALDSFRRALKTYKSGKSRDLFTSENGGRVIRNILLAIKHLHPDNPLEEARKELADELYKDLDDEVAHGAGGLEWSSSLVAEGLLSKPPLQQTYPFR